MGPMRRGPTVRVKDRILLHMCRDGGKVKNNKPEYTATQVKCWWAGVLIEKKTQIKHLGRGRNTETVCRQKKDLWTKRAT